MTSFRSILARRASFAVLSTIVSSSLLAQAGAVPAGKASLQTELEALAQRAKPGVFGIAVVDLASGERWGVNADRAFPMMSDFKAPVSAAVLARIDAGTLKMDQTVVLHRGDVVDGSAVPSVGDRLEEATQHGGEMTVTVGELMTAAVSQSDNTAVDALIRLLGGPEEVTRFLHERGIAETHIGSTEGGISRVFENLHGAAEPPKGETAAQEDQRRRGGYAAYMAAPPNHTTPNAAALFLTRLSKGELLSKSSTEYLLALMAAQTIPRRMREGVPANVRFADKTGTSTTVDGMVAAYNDTGVMTWPDGHTVIVTAYLSGSNAAKADRDALFAELARETAAALRRAGE